MENMRLVREKYLTHLTSLEAPRVIDVGGVYNQPQKSYLRIFEDIPNIEWTVCDIVDHPSVDCVMEGPYSLPFKDETFDLAVSGQMLEHCSNPFKSVAEIRRVLKAEGYLVLIAPAAGPRHDVQDGWRFMDDAFRFIAEDVGGIDTVADWIQKNARDKRSRQWQDHVFVGKKVP
jgi:SAM-dependent methyltransferase